MNIKAIRHVLRRGTDAVTRKNIYRLIGDKIFRTEKRLLFIGAPEWVLVYEVVR